MSVTKVKRFFKTAIALTAVGAVLFSAAGCSDKNEEKSTAPPSQTSEQQSELFGSYQTENQQGSQSPAGTVPGDFTLPESTVSTQGKPKKADGSYDYSYFDDSAFIGNSRVMDFATFGVVKNVYATVGLTVDSVFTESLSGSSVPIIDEINGKNFRRIYLYFGDNECEWDALNVFESRYGKVVDAVRERCPDAEIYLISIMPIGEHASDTNSNDETQEAIDKTNTYIKDLAQSKALVYVDAQQALRNSRGYLPDEASSDGIHLTKKYTCKWVDYLYENT